VGEGLRRAGEWWRWRWSDCYVLGMWDGGMKFDGEE